VEVDEEAEEEAVEDLAEAEEAGREEAEEVVEDTEEAEEVEDSEAAEEVDSTGSKTTVLQNMSWVRWSNQRCLYVVFWGPVPGSTRSTAHWAMEDWNVPCATSADKNRKVPIWEPVFPRGLQGGGPQPCYNGRGNTENLFKLFMPTSKHYAWLGLSFSEHC